jgi:hypothetical protein
MAQQDDLNTIKAVLPITYTSGFQTHLICGSLDVNENV